MFPPTQELGNSHENTCCAAQFICKLELRPRQGGECCCLVASQCCRCAGESGFAVLTWRRVVAVAAGWRSAGAAAAFEELVALLLDASLSVVGAAVLFVG